MLHILRCAYQILIGPLQVSVITEYYTPCFPHPGTITLNDLFNILRYQITQWSIQTYVSVVNVQQETLSVVSLQHCFMETVMG